MFEIARFPVVTRVVVAVDRGRALGSRGGTANSAPVSMTPVWLLHLARLFGKEGWKSNFREMGSPREEGGGEDAGVKLESSDSIIGYRSI